ncbi:MAG: TRAP transporter substrate-binding protein [Hyphomonadaceae bacterium]|nr:TRAP transporter substrate-binding protein [Hyphomonadaceae bacterium]
MDRRSLITSVAVGAAAGAGAAVAVVRALGPGAGLTGAGAAGATQVQAGAVRLNMVTSWPKGMPGLGVSAERVAERARELSGGTLDIRVYAAGELVGAFEVFDAVATGSADLYHSAEYYWGGKHAAYPFFTAVPFGMNALEQSGWLEHGGGQALWDELAGQFGLVPLAVANSCHQAGGWFKRPIESLADFQGLKMRIPGIGGEMVRRLGGAAVALPGGEIYQALQSGVIDAAEFLGPWNDVGLGFFREAPYYYAPGLHEPGAVLALGINKRRFERLSLEHQRVLRFVARDVYLTSIGEFTYQNGVALEDMRTRHNITLRAFPDDVVNAAARISREMWAEAGSTDALGRRIYDSWLKALTAMRPWMEQAESRYAIVRGAALGAGQ